VVSKYILTAERAEAESVFEPRFQVHTSLLTDTEHVQLIWSKFEPGGVYPQHSHPHGQISVLLQGRMRLTVGDEVAEIGPGDMWYAPANVSHGGELLGDDPVVFIDVYSPPGDEIYAFLKGQWRTPTE
jgi:quercetin dioxygenase-like cupin family protein